MKSPLDEVWEATDKLLDCLEKNKINPLIGILASASIVVVALKSAGVSPDLEIQLEKFIESGFKKLIRMQQQENN